MHSKEIKRLIRVCKTTLTSLPHVNMKLEVGREQGYIFLVAERSEAERGLVIVA